VGEGDSGGGDIVADLLLERIDAREGALLAEPGDDSELELSAIEIGVGIQEMGFNADGGVFGMDGRAPADVDDGEGGSVGPAGLGGIDAEWGHHESGDIDVGGREADLATALLAGDDSSADGVGAAEHGLGAGEVSGADRLADASAADGLGFVLGGGEGVGGEAEPSSELAQQGRVAAASVSKVEVLSHMDAGEAIEVADQLHDKGLAAEAAEMRIESDEPSRVQPEAGEGVEALAKRLDQRRGLVGGDDGGWMRVESDGDGESAEGPGVLAEVVEDVLVSSMDAVEDADGEGDGLSGWGELSGLADDSHGRGRGAVPERSRWSRWSGFTRGR